MLHKETGNISQPNSPPDVDANRLSQGDTPSVAISGEMPIGEIMWHLEAHKCKNVTDQIDFEKSTQSVTGTGGFSNIYYGVLKDGSRVGLKCLRLHVASDSGGEKFLKHAAHELYVWSKCRHPNVLDLIGVAKYHGQIAMVSPWLEQGNLCWFLSRNKEIDRCSLCTQIASGVAYLHQNGVVHGDIKGANVLIADDHTVKLTDFGNAALREYTLQFTATTSGGSMSVRWAAPEVANGSKTTTQADVYALGMTILEAVTGSVPYHGINDIAVLMKIVKHDYPARPTDSIPTNNEHGDRLWALLNKCWSHDIQLRPTAAEVELEMTSITQDGLRVTRS